MTPSETETGAPTGKLDFKRVLPILVIVLVDLMGLSIIILVILGVRNLDRSRVGRSKTWPTVVHASIPSSATSASASRAWSRNVNATCSWRSTTFVTPLPPRRRQPSR